MVDWNLRNQNAVQNTSFGELSHGRAIVIEHLSRISEFQRENMKPFSIKRIIFIVVQATGRCTQYNTLVVITYFTYLAPVNSSVIANKQGFREVTETGTQSVRNEQVSARSNSREVLYDDSSFVR